MTQNREVGECSGIVIARGEPAGGLDKEEGANEKEAARDNLNGKCDEPLWARLANSLDNAIVYEEACDTANLPAKLIQPDESATDCGRGDFCNVNRLLCKCEMKLVVQGCKNIRQDLMRRRWPSLR